MRDARSKLVETAAALFQRNGVKATGLAEIIAASQTPKGSLYYYFPQGKDELTLAAITYAGDEIEARVSQALASNPSPQLALQHLLQEMASLIADSGHLNNVSISLIALETVDDPVMQQACATVFTHLTTLYTQKLEQAGLAPAPAADLGALIQATIEGASTIAATKGQPDLLLHTADQLTLLITHAMA